MSEKTGVAGITGDRHPKIGDKAFFKITGWYPATPVHLRDEKHITWELFKRRDDGHYTTTGIKKKGTQYFIFGQTALGHQYRVEGYLNRPEGREPMALEVAPVDTDTPHFTAIQVYDAAGSRVTGALQYGMKVRVEVLSVGMAGKNIKISLWEDAGPGWPKLPRYAESIRATVNKNGVAKAAFVLRADFRQLTGPASQLHEFYITAEYWSSGEKDVYLASEHINLVNPDFRKYDLFERPKPAKTTLPLKAAKQVKDNLPAPGIKAMDWIENPLLIAGSAFRQWVVARGNQKYVVGGKEEEKDKEGEKNNDLDDCSKRFEKVAPIILKHEGGYDDDPDDPGGKTNWGITWADWTAYAQTDLGIAPTVANLKQLSPENATKIYKKRYWEPRGFCKVDDVRIALMIYDWTITSGGAIKEIKRLLHNNYNSLLSIDGHFNDQTIGTINDATDQTKLLDEIGEIRKKYYKSLPDHNLKLKKFVKGWCNRVNDCLAFKP